MSIRVINGRIVHAWVRNGFYVVRACTSNEHVITGAVTCIRGDQNWIWMASSAGFLRRVRLEELTDSVVKLESKFLTSLSGGENCFHSDYAVPVGEGDIYSISIAAADPCQPGQSHDSCNCIIEVFTSKGYMAFGAHDGKFVESRSLTWRNQTEAVAFVHKMEHGPLRDAIVQPGFSSPALIVISVTGSVRVLPGSNYFHAHAHISERSGFVEVATMNQVPVWQTASHGNDFFVVLGCFRAGIVLFPGENGTLRVSRFLLKAESKILTPQCVVITERTASHLEIEDVRTCRRFSFVLHKESAAIKIDLDSGRKGILSKDQGTDEDQSSTMRNLLRGIEALSERERLYESECKEIENFISSYNAALLFVTTWKERYNLPKLRNERESFCQISINLSSSTASPRLQLPNPSAGREIYVTVSFKNGTGVALGAGWMLRMQVFSHNVAQERDHKNVVPPKTKNGSFSNNSNREVRRIMNYPLEKLEPGAHQAVSFPVVVDTHVPFCVSVALVFHHPVSFALVDEHVDIEVPLLDNFIVDILHLSKPSSNADVTDLSHQLLSSSQVMALLDSSHVEKRRGYPTIFRFEVPVPPNDVREALSFSDHSGSFESPLGAYFSVTVSDVALRDGRKYGLLCASSVALRGVPHVLPFVRAAVLRRLLQALSNKTMTLMRITIRDRENIEQWQQSVWRNADDCLPTMREVETKLAQGLGIYRKNHNKRRNEPRDATDESNAIFSALQSAKDAYALWRRENEHLWTPKGATSVISKKKASL